MWKRTRRSEAEEASWDGDLWVGFPESVGRWLSFAVRESEESRGVTVEGKETGRAVSWFLHNCAAPAWDGGGPSGGDSW
jgi:hypothetical protein